MQFGHAGALAQGNLETSDAKNKALAAAGAYVPSSFADMGPLLKALYDKLVSEGTIVPEKDGPVPKVSVLSDWPIIDASFRRLVATSS